MARLFKELREKLSPAAQELSRERIDALLEELYRSKCMMYCNTCSYEGLLPVLAVGETCEECRDGFLEDELHLQEKFMLLLDHKEN
jgi:hypothetical protein